MKSQGLENFISKVKAYGKTDKLCERVVTKIAEQGVEIAKSNYGGSTKVTISSEITNNTARIIAEGEKLNYKEFGTGLVGRGTYEGNLPTETLTFESPKGYPQSTKGWEYYYPNKYGNNQTTKVNGGWYAGGVFHRGQVAEAQMFNTGKQLKKEYGEVAKVVIKEAVD